MCTNELEVLLGPKVASLLVRGKNNKPVDWADDQNSEPCSSCDDALTLGTPSSVGVTTCKTLQETFFPPAPHFFLLIPGQVSQGEK